MSRADRLFIGGAAGLTLFLPGLLLLAEPFGEERATFGVVCGWGLALAIMLPSWVLLMRSLAKPRPSAFLQAFMAGVLLRLVLTMAALLGYALLVEQPALKAFVSSFFLGFATLTALELLAMRVHRAAGEVST